MPRKEPVVEAGVTVDADVVERPPTGVRIGMDAVPVLIEQDVVAQHQWPRIASHVQRMPAALPPNRPTVIVDDAAMDLDVRARRVSVKADPAVVHDQVDVLGVGRVVVARLGSESVSSSPQSTV